MSKRFSGTCQSDALPDERKKSIVIRQYPRGYQLLYLICGCGKIVEFIWRKFGISNTRKKHSNCKNARAPKKTDGCRVVAP